MSNNGKPTALQSDTELAASAFESMLTPEEDNVENVLEEQDVAQEEVIEDDSEFVEDELMKIDQVL